MSELETTVATREEILRAGEVLVSPERADQVLDQDFPVIKGILDFPGKSDRQLVILWTILGAYAAVLAGAGVSYEALVPPEPSHHVDRPAETAVEADKVIEFIACEGRQGPVIAVRFPYEKGLVDLAKKLKNRRFDGDGKISGLNKCWVIPSDPASLTESIKLFEKEAIGYKVVTDSILPILEAGKRSFQESRSEDADLEVPTKLPLYPFQRAGVKWIDERDGRALVADEPGLGKTAQALGWLALRKKLPALVLCPATLRINWLNEVRQFTDFKGLVISAKTSLKQFEKRGIPVSTKVEPGYDIVIANYDVFSVETPKKWMKMLLSAGTKEDLDYACTELISAGKQVLGFLEDAKEKHKHSIDMLNRITRPLNAIKDLKDDARSTRAPAYIKIFGNGLPLAEFMGDSFKTLVSDEMHYVKDPAAQRSMAALAISEILKYSIGLTGTPILNRSKEIWNLTQLINKSLFPKFFPFGLEYCNGHQKRAGANMVWDFSGNSNTEKLSNALRSTIMIRRTKDQVLKELPAKTRTMIPFIAEEKEEKTYRKETEPAFERLAKLKKERDEWKALMERMPQEDRAAYLALHAEKASRAGRLTNLMIEDLERLKQAAVKAKFDQCVKFILNLYEQQPKLLIFASHHETIDKLGGILCDEGIKTDYIDGRIDQAKRDPIKDSFQNGDCEVLVCGIRAAGEGLTLTASRTVVFLELDSNPARHIQAEDRTHRISQKNAVSVYYLVLLGSIEEKLAKMIDGKREIINAVMGEGERSLSEDGILDAVLEDILS